MAFPLFEVPKMLVTSNNEEKGLKIHYTMNTFGCTS